jgi:hypothetical protein
MKYLVEVHLNPGAKNQAIEAFEQRGPNRTPHIKFDKAWLGSRTEVAFIVVSSDSENHVAEACKAWSGFGTIKIHPVIDIEQY